MARTYLLVGGKTPQLRRGNKKSWTKQKGIAFLSVLAETCNVSEACRKSRLPKTVAYRRRKMDAAFRAGWIEAIGAAYHKLELVLLERAFNGVEKVFRRRDGSDEKMREFSDQLGLALLRMHRDTAVEAEHEMPPEDIAEIRQRLVDKLQRLKQRDDEDEKRAEEGARDEGASDDGAGDGAAQAEPGERTKDEAGE